MRGLEPDALSNRLKASHVHRDEPLVHDHRLAAGPAVVARKGPALLKLQSKRVEVGRQTIYETAYETAPSPLHALDRAGCRAQHDGQGTVLLRQAFGSQPCGIGHRLVAPGLGIPVSCNRKALSLASLASAVHEDLRALGH